MQYRITDRGFEFTDNMEFKIVGAGEQSLDKIKDNFLNQPMSPNTINTSHGPYTAKGLVVQVAATHAGLITRNNSMYLPDRMRSGVASWTDTYFKPVLTHHDESSDPIGRIIQAEYVDTTRIVKDHFVAGKNSAAILKDSAQNFVGLINDKFWDEFVSSEVSFQDKLSMLKVMDSVLTDRQYQGVGYTRLTLDITDKDAQAKVLDGRYLTGSISAVSDKAVCSICDTNWLEAEHCGHRPGRMYDGRKCYIVAGNLENDHWAFVNEPADRHASVLSVHQNNFVPENEVKDSASVFFMPLLDSVETEEDSHMEDVKNTEVEVTSEDSAAKVESSTETILSPDAEGQEENKVEDFVEEESDELTEILDKAFSEEPSLTEEESDKLYDAMIAEIEQSEDEQSEDIKDAKLSTAARKKLPKSAFCGPNRSFPAHDCAHVTAARRLIGRYKGPGSKDAILACVNRKAKALGCNKSEDGVCEVTTEDQVQDNMQANRVIRSLLNVLEENYYVPKDEDSVLSDDDKSMLSSLVQKLAKMLGKDAVASSLVKEGLAVSLDEFDAQLAETARLEDELGDKNDQLSLLRKELSAVFDDVATVEDELIKAKVLISDMKKEKLAILHKLDGDFSDEVQNEILELSDSALDNHLELLGKKVDISKISDSLNSGLSRTPEEEVDSPLPAALPSNAADVEMKDKAKPTLITQKFVDNKYRQIMIHEGNPQKAKQFYNEQVKLGRAMPRPDLEEEE